MDKQKDINLVIENFREGLIQYLNSTELPPSVTFYIFKDVYQAVEKDYGTIINNLMREEQKRALMQNELQSNDINESESTEDVND